MWTAHSFARLVKKLRHVQRANGAGYKTPAGGQTAKKVEQEVDAAIKWIENHWFPFMPQPKPKDKTHK